MAIYLMGDVQGCYQPFKKLLERIDFSPSRDHLFLLGDVVNRGPQSLETLDAVIRLEGAATCLLGNHDIHLLAVAYGLRKQRPSDTLTPVLESPRLWHYIEWLRHQHMAVYAHGWLMVHAGVYPQWSCAQTLGYAHEVEAQLRSPEVKGFLKDLFGNVPDAWSDQLTGMDRWRAITNALTRMRFCDANGRMNFNVTSSLQDAPPELVAWFKYPGRQTENVPVAFGHWSTLGFTTGLPNLLALDTGCLWGGQLTAARIAGDAHDAAGRSEIDSEPLRVGTAFQALAPPYQTYLPLPPNSTASGCNTVTGRSEIVLTQIDCEMALNPHAVK